MSDKHVQAALGRVPDLDHQGLLNLRENALRMGEAARPVVEAIDERLEAFQAGGGMAPHRLELARVMMRKVSSGRPGQWLAARELFLEAVKTNANNPFVIWMKGNSAREIPMTKALEDVSGEFPDIEREKHANGRVFFRLKPGASSQP